MGKSKLNKGWGTFVTLALITAVSSCSESKKPGRELAPTFDYFAEECNPATRNEIVGGKAVQLYDTDSNRSVLLISKTSDGSQSLCSATKISDRVLLTAAHCVNEAAQLQAVFYTDVTCGSGYRRSQHAIPAAKFIFHPQYKPGTNMAVLEENPDLALVLLAEDSPKYYPAMRIHESPENLNSDIYLYGFGISGTFHSDQLRMRKAIVKHADTLFTNKAVFFDQEGKPGVCNGDSGGAGLMLDQGEYFIASVNAMVFRSELDVTDDLCNRMSKSVIVHHYRSWIENIMSAWGEKLAP